MILTKNIIEIIPGDSKRAFDVRKFQAEIYRSRGNVNEDQITSEGLLGESTDPYYQHSIYFIAKNARSGSIEVCARLIMPIDGRNSLQIREELNIKILNQYPENSPELSGLAKLPHVPSIRVLNLLAFIINYCKDQKITHVYSTLTKEPYERYMRIFNNEIKLLSEPVKISKGNNIVYPTVIEIGKFVKPPKKVMITNMTRYLLLRQVK